MAGSLQVVVSDQFAKHATETGLRVREYAPPQGESIQCTVAADDDRVDPVLFGWNPGGGLEPVRALDQEREAGRAMGIQQLADVRVEAAEAVLEGAGCVRRESHGKAAQREADGLRIVESVARSFVPEPDGPGHRPHLPFPCGTKLYK